MHSIGGLISVHVLDNNRALLVEKTFSVEFVHLGHWFCILYHPHQPLQKIGYRIKYPEKDLHFAIIDFKNI